MNRRLRAIVYAGLAFLLAGCASIPGSPPDAVITAEVVSEPQGIEVAFKGRPVGQTPLELEIDSLDDAVALSSASKAPPVLERRIQVIDPHRVRIVLRLEGGPSPMMQALGLSEVVVFDYGAMATFEVDKYDLKSQFHPILEHQAALLEEHFPGLPIYVCGHTDATGTDDHNRVLSLRRAEAVADFLNRHGVDAERLEAQGFGPDFPLADNSTREGKARNRRTEIILAN